MGKWHGRMVGNFVRADTRRLLSAARANCTVWAVARSPPPAVTAIRRRALNQARRSHPQFAPEVRSAYRGENALLDTLEPRFLM
jgi:hypothetical protein